MKPFTDALRRAVAPLSLKVDATAVKVDATAAKVAELAVDQKQTAASVQSALVMSSHAFAKATTALSSTSTDCHAIAAPYLPVLILVACPLSHASDCDDTHYHDGSV